MKMLVLISFMALGLYGLALAWKEYYLIKKLQKVGVIVNAEIVRKRMVRERIYRAGYITYRFRNDLPHDKKLYTREQLVSFETCRSLSVGTKIPVQFLRNDPLNTARLTTDVADNTFEMWVTVAAGLICFVIVGAMYLFVH